MSLSRRSARALCAALALAGLLAASSARAEPAPRHDGWFARVVEAARAVRELAWKTGRLTVVPVDAEVTSEFGYRRDPINRRRRLHRGLDFDAGRGARVLAAGSGEVVFARRKGGYGRVVIIDHGFGLRTRYAHLRRIRVRRGDIVSAGQLVGTVGSTGRATGPHLHFEVRRDGKAIDPRRVLPIDGVTRERRAGS